MDSNRQQEVRDTFNEFDKDGNGYIDASELATALRRLGLDPSHQEIQSMIAEVDSDGNRNIDFDEFLHFVKRTYRDPEEHKCSLIEAFKIFDVNRDGFITRDELKSVLTKMGEKLSDEEFDEKIRVADRNGDGKIDYEEYAKLMCQ